MAMKIEPRSIKVKEIFHGYIDNNEEGVVGFGGKLDIRPKYQRNFVYDDKKRAAVINTIKNGFPLNVMYWAKTGDDAYEVLDGQQRTISFCQYLNGDFSFDGKYAHNLTSDEREKIENYELLVYVCEGTDKEKLDWFEIVNIAGEKLTAQELRNAVYVSEWLTDAKRYFSKSNCPAYGLAEKYMSGSPIRQDYLETVLKWISEDKIEEYMAKHANDTKYDNASELWQYFRTVISWLRLYSQIIAKK